MNDPASAPRVLGNPVSDLPLPDLARFTHRWVDGGGVRLHAVEGGRADGPTVVLLAGFPQTWWAWHKVMPALADRFHVIAVDLPGPGPLRTAGHGYDTHTVAAHVHAAVEALGVSTYGLAAHDIGAWVAFSLASKYQDQLRGLALLDAGIRASPSLAPSRSSPNGLEDLALRLPPRADLPETLLTGRERGVRRLVPEGQDPFRRHLRRGRDRLRRGRGRGRRSPRVPGLLPGRRRVGSEEPRSAGAPALSVRFSGSRAATAPCPTWRLPSGRGPTTPPGSSCRTRGTSSPTNSQVPSLPR
ncbi:Haloalkane dehalogenase [Streptomyces tendae]